MNILMHCVYFPPEVGGLESHIYYLCKALVEKGHTVDVVTARSQPGLAAHEVMAGIGVHRTWMPSRNTPGWAAHAMASMPVFGGLAKKADILHAQDIAGILPCMVAQRVKRAPLVTTYHSSHFLMRAESPFWRPIFRKFVEAADHNLAASAQIAEVGEAIAPGHAVEALTNGVETEFFRRIEPALEAPPEGRMRLVVPRRLFHKNGVEFFVRAMPLIVSEIDVEAIVVGDGPERDTLERLAGDLGVSDRIRFMGAQPNPTMPGLLSSADLAVFPSLMEATSVAALEAMACELPVAASDVGGLPEIVNDAVGGLFEPGNPTALAAKVVELLRGGRIRDLGAEARRQVVESWSNDRLAERHLAIYEALLARNGAA